MMWWAIGIAVVLLIAARIFYKRIVATILDAYLNGVHGCSGNCGQGRYPCDCYGRK